MSEGERRIVHRLVVVHLGWGGRKIVSNVSDTSELLADAFSDVFIEGAPPISAQHQSFASVLEEV